MIKEININTEFIRLDSLLKLSGATATGGQAKIAVLNGEVYVNGQVCRQRGKKLKNGDIIEYKNKIYKINGEDFGSEG